jgi:uncharacterized protein YqgC (DUF456 family)
MPGIEVDAGPLTIAIVALVMGIGLLGTLLPVLPGVPLIWAAALGFGIAEGFGTLGIAAMVAISVVGVFGIAASVMLPARRAATAGAPRSTLAAGATGGLVGFFVIPVIGLVLGAVAGVLVAEYNRTHRWDVAWTSTKGVVIGFGIGVLAELAAGLVMIVAWVAWVFAA